MTAPDPRIRRHFALGWVLVAISALFGLGLEAMHGLKLGAYLDLDVATRRHMWTLAHAHGTLLGVLQIAFAATLRGVPALADGRAGPRAGRLLGVASVLMPAGFFLGGLWFYAGDPGPGVLLVPVGGVALIAAVVVVALACR
ncbi:MAG: hypothetical protein KC486_20855 [Myxococcales bacterium]|nr:hypothetical protein [Myxococcales bacterium]